MKRFLIISTTILITCFLTIVFLNPYHQNKNIEPIKTYRDLTDAEKNILKDNINKVAEQQRKRKSGQKDNTVNADPVLSEKSENYITDTEPSYNRYEIVENRGDGGKPLISREAISNLPSTKQYPVLGIMNAKDFDPGKTPIITQDVIDNIGENSKIIQSLEDVSGQSLAEFFRSLENSTD